MCLLLSFVLASTGVTIVYCRSIAMVSRVCQYLRHKVDSAQKPSVRSFHANLISDYKDGVLKMLKAGMHSRWSSQLKRWVWLVMLLFREPSLER